MAGIFATGPSRSPYMSAASNNFLAPHPVQDRSGEQFADTLGSVLGQAGVSASGIRAAKPSSLDTFRLHKMEAEDAASKQIGELAAGATIDDIQARYRQALVVGARVGMDQKRVDDLFTGTARAIGGGDNTIGRLMGGGGYGAGTYFSPDSASAGRTQERDFKLADQAADVAEHQRQEKVREALEGKMEGIRQRGRTTLESLRNQNAIDRENTRVRNEKDLAEFRSGLERDRNPGGVAVTGIDDLRQAVVEALADQGGVGAPVGGNLPENMTAEPGAITDIMRRAGELSQGPNKLPIMDAITQAIQETTKMEDAGSKGVDLGMLGIWGKSDKKTVKRNPDPLGLLGP